MKSIAARRMMFSYRYLIFLPSLFALLSVAATLPPNPQLIDGDYGTALNTNLQAEVHCTPNTTAAALTMFSCSNAWHKIRRTTAPVVYASRAARYGAGVSLPFRFLSDDGLCAIDIDIAPGKRGDVSNGIGISNAARDIIETCVPKQSMSGEKTGFSKHLATRPTFVDREDKEGGEDALTSKQHPKAGITCYPPTSAMRLPYAAACQEALQLMPASDQSEVVFARDGRTGDVKLPWVRNQDNLYHPTMYKKAIVKWYDLWAAGVAVNEMCVDKLKIGVAGPIDAMGRLTSAHPYHRDRAPHLLQPRPRSPKA
ncbi:MAG: hypothetical protein Q9218_003966 [Villophora microphyllina]